MISALNSISEDMIRQCNRSAIISLNEIAYKHRVVRNGVLYLAISYTKTFEKETILRTDAKRPVSNGHKNPG